MGAALNGVQRSFCGVSGGGGGCGEDEELTWLMNLA